MIFVEEKVQLANSMADSMAKYMRRLDQDLMKFKMELEADNCGITEIIEKSKSTWMNCELGLLYK